MRPARQVRAASAAALLGSLVAASPAAASPPEQAPPTYEEARTREVLQAEGFEPVEPQALAEGKRIAFVHIAREEVFVDDEGPMSWFQWANIFHWKTRERVVRRELLFERGDAYRGARIEETMRNLRDLQIFSYARIVPVEADDPDEVGVVVYTRDLWSLRLESDFQLTGKQLDLLFLRLTERNLFGLRKEASGQFLLQPFTWSIGQNYFDYRAFGGKLTLAQSGELIFNRRSGNLEGGVIGAALRRPFYNLAQRFGFDLTATYATRVQRQIRNGRRLLYDIPETEDVETIRRVWRRRELIARGVALFRRGRGHRQTFGLGWDVRDQHVDPIAETRLRAGQQMAFARDVLPRVRREIGPVVTYDLFTPRFPIFENLGSYGQSETVRAGPKTALQVRFPLRALGSSSDSLVFDATFGYTLILGDVLAKAELAGHTRLENGEAVDQRLSTELRAASPVLGFVRLVGRMRWEGRRNDTSNPVVTLGGDSGLRGYVSQAFVETSGDGKRLLGNFEIRTLPVELWSVHVGAVLFYDVGTVYDSLDALTLHHGVGVGLRVLFPQFNRTPFRLDLGVPVEPGGAMTPVPSLGARQVVPLSRVEEAAAQ